MKTLIVYDSFFGNTEQVAQTIASTLDPLQEVTVLRVDKMKVADLKGVQLLVVGSPTRAFSPSPAVKNFLNRIPAGSLAGVKVTAFDTGIAPADISSPVLRSLVKLFGYAAPTIARKLGKKGGEQVASPAGFFVADTKGPLKDGEKERARQWVEQFLLKL